MTITQNNKPTKKTETKRDGITKFTLKVGITKSTSYVGSTEIPEEFSESCEVTLAIPTWLYPWVTYAGDDGKIQYAMDLTGKEIEEPSDKMFFMENNNNIWFDRIGGKSGNMWDVLRFKDPKGNMFSVFITDAKIMQAFVETAGGQIFIWTDSIFTFSGKDNIKSADFGCQYMLPVFKFEGSKIPGKEIETLNERLCRYMCEGGLELGAVGVPTSYDRNFAAVSSPNHFRVKPSRNLDTYLSYVAQFSYDNDDGEAVTIPTSVILAPSAYFSSYLMLGITKHLFDSAPFDLSVIEAAE